MTHLVWERLGDVRNYVEPFAGSLAVLLGRPQPFHGTETVNDACGLICNFWRATKADPGAVADHADHPVLENDLHARHAWLVGRKDSLQARLEGDPDYFDAKVAGWWVWGIACWIGSGFCSGRGPWRVAEADDGSRQRLHLTNAGQGVNRQREDHRADLFAYFRALSERLRHVRVCCGDWSRVMGDSPMLVRSKCFTPVGVFLDPPYGDTAKRCSDLYRIDSEQVAHKVREWAIAHGDDPRYRIALAGYAGEHTMPDSWECVAWKAQGGYSHQRLGTVSENRHRERLWFSPSCLKPAEKTAACSPRRRVAEKVPA